MINYSQLSMQIELLSSEQLMVYFKMANIFPDVSLLLERVNKLSANASFVTMRHNKQIVALIGYYMNQKPLCYITHVSVLAFYKHQGLATKMLKFLEQQAKIEGFSIIRLEVAKRNLPALGLYDKLGFIIASDNERGNYYMEKLL